MRVARNRARFTWWVALALTTVLGSFGVRGDEAGDPAVLRRELVDAKLSLIQAEAANVEIGQLLKTILAPPLSSDPFPPMEGSEDYWKQLDGLTKKAETVAGSLKDQLNRCKSEFQAASISWRSAQDHNTEFRSRGREIRARLGVDGAYDGKMLGAGAWGAILFGAIAVISGLLLVAHDLRPGIRWKLRAWANSPTTILIVAILASGCGRINEGAGGKRQVGLSTVDREDLQSQRDNVRGQLVEADRAVAEAQAKLAHEHKTRLDSTLEKPKTEAEAEIIRRFHAAEGSNRDSLVASLCLSRAVRDLADDALATTAAHRQEQTVLGRTVDSARGGVFRDGIVRESICLGLLLFSFGTLFLVRGRARSAVRRQARVCPRCLGKNSLRLIDSPLQDERYPESRYLECDACRYQFRESFSQIARLCFPTLGITVSGKTVWLISCYDQIKNGNIPVRASITRVPSSDDLQWDSRCKELFHDRVWPEGTVRGLPAPLVFHVHDKDPLGRSATLVNIFDFAGGLMNQSIDEDILKRNALLYDGFTLFLDPTQLTDRGMGQTIDDQIRTLSNFREDLRAIRGTPLGRPVDVPIAVCVTKLEMLSTENPLGDQAIAWLRRLRETSGTPLTLDLIQQRSKLVAEVLPQIFPGWNIVRTLQENFGGRFMFFPVTPIGMEEAELGITDLSRRTFAPFGVLEPLIWLMHMHGYKVLD